MNWTAHELERCTRPSTICRKRTVRFLAGDERCDRISHGHSRSVKQRIGQYHAQEEQLTHDGQRSMKLMAIERILGLPLKFKKTKVRVSSPNSC
jgi:hypothetical protein